MADYIFEQSQIDFLRANKVTPFVKGKTSTGSAFDIPVIAGTVIKQNNEVYYLADYGYEFQLVGSSDASIGARSGTGAYNRYKYDFDNPSRAYQIVGFSYVKTTFVTLVEKPIDVVTKGVNNAYLIDSATMREVINANFVLNDGQTSKDYGQYILGLIELPFLIEPDAISLTDDAIKLAAYDTGLTGDLLKSDVLKVNLGTLTIPATDNNLLDFANKTAIIHLPYCEPFNIETKYLIGESVSIEYLINLYDGLAIINIYSTKIDDAIVSKTVDLNVSIPFGSVSSQPSKNDPHNVTLGGDNGVKTAYIELLSSDAILPYGFFTSPIIDETVLNLAKGYIEVDNINLSTKATNQEREQIRSYLRSGVIIQA